MIKNTPEKFKRDLWILRCLIVLLSSWLIWYSFNYFGNSECHPFGGMADRLVSEICSMVGPDVTGVIIVLASMYTVWKVFSKEVREKMHDDYS